MVRIPASHAVNAGSIPVGPSKIILVPHPGNVNDPWDWLRTVADAMLAAGWRGPGIPSMLDAAYRAYLGHGLQACFDVVRQHSVVIEDKVV